MKIFIVKIGLRWKKNEFQRACNKIGFIAFVALTTVALLSMVCSPSLALVTQAVEPTLETVEHGTYWRYLPSSVTPESPVLVLCHGMLGENDSAETVAKKYVGVWAEFASETGTVLVAPAFNDKDFGGRDGCPHGWGYRGLYGRHVQADEYLHEMIDQLKEMNPNYDGRMFMFGHSAGGQFVSHYVVTHPDRVQAAIISSPAWLPFPTMSDNWPRGLKPRTSSRRWPGEKQDQVVEMVPDPELFVAAAELPLLATVGELDVEMLRHNDSQGGDNHVERIVSWTEAMNQFAEEKGKAGNITCFVVPGVGHSSKRLSASSMPFLAEQIRIHYANQKKGKRQ